MSTKSALAVGNLQQSYQQLLISLGFSHQKATQVTNGLNVRQLEMIEEICFNYVRVAKNSTNN